MSRVHGIDISKYQPEPFPWQAAAQTNKFVFIRASVGNQTDPLYPQHKAFALAQRLMTGAYHFLWKTVPPVEQAHIFTSIMGSDLTLPPVVDVELNTLTEDIVRGFVEEVFRITRQRCIIYTRKNLWETYIGHKLLWAKRYPLWVAQYINAESPTAIPDSWDTWDFWQYGSTKFPGYTYPDGSLRPVDANYFNGTEEQLRWKYIFHLRWPTDYPIITQPYGARPEYYGQWGLPGHEGLDIKAPFGANVYACAPGVVYQVREADGNAYGLHVRIDHENGYKTVYAHLHRALVTVGDRVEEGQVIGLADSTGNSSGSHLHLTLKKDGATASGETNYPNDIINPLLLLDVPTDTQMPIYLKSNTTGGLRVRSGPAIVYDIIYTIASGETVEALDEPGIVDCLIGKQEHWLKIKTKTGKVGWSAAWFLKKT